MSTSQVRNFFSLFCLIAGITACNINQPCEEPTQFPIKTGFYDSSGTDTTLSDLSIFGIGMEDSLLYDRDTTQMVSFPLNPFTDLTRFVVIFGSLADTLTFQYKRNLRMINPECGFAVYFQIENFDHTGHFVDSLTLLDPYLNADTQEHLQIYVH